MITNLGDQQLVIDEVIIEASEYNVRMDIAVTENGLYKLKRIQSNSSEYIPSDDELIRLTGIIGDQII